MNKPENVISKTPIDKISLVKLSEAPIQPTILPTVVVVDLVFQLQEWVKISIKKIVLLVAIWAIGSSSANGPTKWLLWFPSKWRSELMPYLLFLPAAWYVTEKSECQTS